jgi:hypothetical protein
MTDAYENRPTDMDIKFNHNQEVQVIKGFYRGNIGTITGYTLRDNKVYYCLNIDSLNLILFVDESDLQTIKKVSLLKKLFKG